MALVAWLLLLALGGTSLELLVLLLMQLLLLIVLNILARHAIHLLADLLHVLAVLLRLFIAHGRTWLLRIVHNILHAYQLVLEFLRELFYKNVSF